MMMMMMRPIIMSEVHHANVTTREDVGAPSSIGMTYVAHTSALRLIR